MAVVAHEFRPYYDDDHHPVTMGEQVIVMGGSDDTAVWLSEDGGSTFTCQDRPQPWEPLDFPSVFDLAFTDTWWMAGGVMRTVPPGSFVGIFVTRDWEANFSRPQCASTCPNPYNNSWLLPTIGPIAIGNRGAAYQWDVPGFGVYTLSNDTVGIGFTRLQGAVSGGYGRKVFIKADPFSGAGCWVSVDYTPSDLWAGATTPWGLNSTNGIAIAEHAEGPRTEVGPAPWEPRAAAALVTEELVGGYAIFASGLGFENGAPNGQTFGDMWRIDVSVCLMSGKTKTVCGGRGVPHVPTLTCSCEAGYGCRTCDAPV